MKIFYGIIIGIIGTILSFIVFLSFNGVGDDCQKCRSAMVNISSLNNKIIKYAQKNNSLPQQLEDVTQKIIDPWGVPYNYISYQHDQYECFLVWSFGSDNKPGGNKRHEFDIYSFHFEGCIPNQLVPNVIS